MSNLSPSATKCLASSPCLGEGFEQSLPNASLWHPNPGSTDLNSVPLDSSYGSGVDMSCKAPKKNITFLRIIDLYNTLFLYTIDPTTIQHLGGWDEKGIV
jgi:hypothetical protein